LYRPSLIDLLFFPLFVFGYTCVDLGEYPADKYNGFDGQDPAIGYAYTDTSFHATCFSEDDSIVFYGISVASNEAYISSVYPCSTMTGDVVITHVVDEFRSLGINEDGWYMGYYYGPYQGGGNVTADCPYLAYLIPFQIEDETNNILIKSVLISPLLTITLSFFSLVFTLAFATVIIFKIIKQTLL